MSHTSESFGNGGESQNAHDFAAEYNAAALRSMHTLAYHDFWLIDPHLGIRPELEQLDAPNREMLDRIYRQFGIDPSRPERLKVKHAKGRYDREAQYITDNGLIITESEFSNRDGSQFRAWAMTPDLLQ